MAEKRILIVVDMLKDFINEDGALFCGPTAQAIVPKVKELVDEHRKDSKATIIFLADAHDADDAEFDRFPKHCVAGTDGAEVIDELSEGLGPATEVKLNKKRYSGFYDTGLDAILKIDTEGIPPEDVVVEVCGVCTSICVMDTVGGFANRDYKVKINKDAVADFDQEMHAMALKRMAALYGAEII